MMYRIKKVLMTQFLLIGLIFAYSQNPVNIPNNISVIKSDETGIDFRISYSNDAVKQEKIKLDGNEYTVFEITSASRRNKPGELDLPSQELVIGIPPEGEISLSAQVVSHTYADNIQIPPVPYQTFEGRKDYRLVQDIQDNEYPAQVYEITSIGYFRNNRIARIKFYPVQYHEAKRRAVIANEISVAIRFSNPARFDLVTDYFDGVFADIAINGAQAVSWKSAVATNRDFNYGYSRYPQGFTNWYKIKIESTGVYKLTYNELKQAGVPVDIIDPRTIRLFNIGEYISNVDYPDTMIEIPIALFGESDSVFNRKDYILFFGVSPNRYNRARSKFNTNVFTKYNYYWLTWGMTSSAANFGKRMQKITSTSQGISLSSAENYIRLEKDRDCPARNGLLWIWEFYTKESGVINKSFNLPIEITNPESLYALSGRFYGQTSANWLRIGINNTMLDSFYFTGWSTSPPPFNFSINQRLPLSDANTINFQLYNQSNQEVFLDYLDCRYRQKLALPQNSKILCFYSQPGDYQYKISNVSNRPLVFDIDDYFTPKMISGYYQNRDTIIFGVSVSETSYYYITDESRARSVLSIEQKNPGQTYSYADQDYYIIVADELFESARLFENYRHHNITGINQAKAIAVPLSRIYDDFTFGIEEPGAIKRLFKKNRPYYGLLLGDGTYDYRNILGLANFPAVPAYESGYDIDFQVYSTGAIAFDAWYADFDGMGSSPDMILGRVTARTGSEVRRYYDKLVSYESNTTCGLWNKRFLFLSDDEWKGQGAPDEFGFEHIANNENLENNLYTTTNQKFRHYEPVKVYLTEYPFSETRDKRKAREALLAELSRGVSLWCYFGHGAGFQLAHEQALNIVHVPLVNTNRRNFISFYGSCGVGRFEDTKFESVAEELVRKYDAGIATVAASKATYSGINFAFANIFFSQLINQPDSTIGNAFLRGWFVDSSYHLFGDPAAIPALPNNFGNLSVLPDTLRSGQQVTAQSIITGSARYAGSAYAGKWRRQYTSSIGTIYYNLAGYEVFRGLGNTSSGVLDFSFMMPTGLPRQNRYDVLNGAGFYTEIERSARITALAFKPGQKIIYSYLKDTIPFDTLEMSNIDNRGPQIAFYIGDKRIKANDRVTKQFELTGLFRDSSGILMAPIVGFNPRLIVKKQPNRILEDVDVTAYFNYDLNSYYQGRVKYPVTLDTGKCLVTFKIADNLRNVSSDSVELSVERSQNLVFENVLYYSPLNARNGYFTFELSKPARVDIKIYTIVGRLVKTISDRMCSFGYNQIEWDGLDQSGQVPANGVYLYKITGHAVDLNREERQSVIEKLIISH